MSSRVARAPRGLENSLWNFDDHIHDLLPNGSKFGEDVWDYKSIAAPGDATRKLNFASLPEGYRSCVRSFIALRGRPTYPEVVARGVVLRGKPASVAAIGTIFHKLYLLARWGESKELGSFSSWTPKHASMFVQDVREGTHRPGGKPSGPTSVRGLVSVLKQLDEWAPVLPDTLPFLPWPARTAANVAGEKRATENKTKPLPWETWAPLVAGAWTVVDRCGDLIVRAHAASLAAPSSHQLSRGLTKDLALDALAAFFDAGGKVPLHTGYGRSGGAQRGQPNRSMLLRLTGISQDVFKPAHRAFDERAIQIVEAEFERGNTAFGGLLIPSDSSDQNWVAEIGLAESEFLESVLRGACYVMIASLSGMRDGEIQEIEIGALSTEDGIRTLGSVQRKGRSKPGGEFRGWWVPRAIERTIEVLEGLATQPLLFARGGRHGLKGTGTYAASRDIRRLLQFLTSSPETRPGRGVALELEPIPTRHAGAVTATSLRRSFAVFAAARPGAEIGIGIQLGKASLRATGPYIGDSQKVAVDILSTERAAVVRQEMARLARSAGNIAGGGADELLAIRAHIVADPKRAESLAKDFAENYHLGLLNDCNYRKHSAACGDHGPQLATHFCAGSECANAVVHAAHTPMLSMHISRLDRQLERTDLHPSFEANIRRQRESLVRLRAQIENPEAS
jgi:hypothetical protein